MISRRRHQSPQLAHPLNPPTSRRIYQVADAGGTHSWAHLLIHFLHTRSRWWVVSAFLSAHPREYYAIQTSGRPRLLVLHFNNC